jgi:hypothetical protein
MGLGVRKRFTGTQRFLDHFERLRRFASVRLRPRAAARLSLALFTLISVAAHVLVLLALSSLSHEMRTVPVTGGAQVIRAHLVSVLVQPQSAAADAGTDANRTNAAPAHGEPQPAKPAASPAKLPAQNRPKPSAVHADDPASVTSQQPNGDRMDAQKAHQASPQATQQQTVQVSSVPSIASAHEPASATPGAPGAIAPLRLPRAATLAYQATAVQEGRLTPMVSRLDWNHDDDSFNLRWTLSSPATGECSRFTAGQVFIGNLTLASDRAAGAAMPACTQVPMSALIELGAMIAGDPSRYPVGSTVWARVMYDDGQPARAAAFVIVDNDDFAAGGQYAGTPLPALHLVHVPAGNSNARVEVWLGPSFDYLPVRLLILQPGGPQLDMTLQGAVERKQ